MKTPIYIRRCERYTSWQATEPIEINLEKIRKCDPPYEGETEESLLSYIQDNVFSNEDWFETNKEFYGEEEAYDLVFMEDSMEIYSDTRDKYSQEWLDVGIPNEEHRRMGNFEVLATSVENA